MKVTQITDGLYIRGKFFDIQQQDKRVALRKLGITYVVNLVRHEDWDLYQSAEIMYEHIPISDGRLATPVADKLTVLARRLAIHIKHGGGVLVFCNAGRNRSGLLAALILHELYPISGNTALGWVRRARPRAVANEHFARYLNSVGINTEAVL